MHRIANQLGWTGGEAFGSSRVCGASDAHPLTGCAQVANWTSAREACEAPGARLCSLDELSSDEARGTGCGFDDEDEVYRSVPPQHGGAAAISLAAALQPEPTHPLAGPAELPESHHERMRQLLVELLRVDRPAYIETASFLNIPRLELPNLQDVRVRDAPAAEPPPADKAGEQRLEEAEPTPPGDHKPP